jgi:DUF4097 and DUF4098 domain-containing protein YvlB
MTIFQTTDPISVSLEFLVGDLRLVASDLGETVVEVKPSNPAKAGDVNAANLTQVEYASGALLVKGPKNKRQWTPWSMRGDSIDVEIQLPEGSRLNVEVGMGAVHSSGRLGKLDVKTGMGDVRIDEAGPTWIRTGFGEVTVSRIDGDADVKTGSGRVEIGSIEGSVTVKNSNGDTRIGAVAGHAQLKNANGTIQVDSARSNVTAKTACGDVRLGVVSRGSTEASTAYGKIEIGVLEGVAAWLDLSTGFGRVSNELEDTEPPSADARTTQIRARTTAGDINVSRVRTYAEIETRS